MALKNPQVDYDTELRSIREIYAHSNLRQRLNIVSQRLTYKDSLPNKVINAVSAVEGFARILLCRLSIPEYGNAITAYRTLRNLKPEALVRSILCRQTKDDPACFFGEDTWELFGYAVRYRHMIIHECTFVGQDKAPSMILASREILVWLASVAGYKNFDPDL